MRPGLARIGLALVVLFGAGCNGLAGAPLWEQPAPAVEDRPLIPAERLQRGQLGNGVEVVVLEDHRLPRIAFGVVVRRGAASESLETAGIASFMSELMQRGAGARDALGFARAVDEIGASFDVGADWDAISASIAGLSRDADGLLPLLVDAVLRPRFEATEAMQARAERLAALERLRDDPDALLSKHLARALYGGHRYGIPLEGDIETVSRFDARAARGFHERVFVPGNAIVYAVGDIDPKAFLARAESVFGAWRGTAPPPAPPPAPVPVPAVRRVVIVDRPDLVQTQIGFGHEGISRSDPERFAAMLTNTVLGGGGFSSRLMKTVRSDAGLTYSIGSGFASRREGGPFIVSTFTRVAEARRVVDLVLAELERIRNEPPTEAELADAKTQTVGGFALGLETSAAIAGSLVSLDVQGLPRDSLDVFRGRIRGLSTDDAATAARGRIHPDRVAIVLVGPAAELQSQMSGLGPVEIIKP